MSERVAFCMHIGDGAVQHVFLDDDNVIIVFETTHDMGNMLDQMVDNFMKMVEAQSDAG